MGRLRRAIVAILALAVVLMGASACGSDSETPPPPSTSPGTPEGSPPPPASNQAPVILSLDLTPNQTEVNAGGEVHINCVAMDPDDDPLQYQWAATGGRFSEVRKHAAVWEAPSKKQDWDITVTVSDGEGGVTKATLVLKVVSNQSPMVSSLSASPTSVAAGDTSLVTCVASDPDGDPLSYSWKCERGEITGVGETVTWIAPDVLPGEASEFLITATVADGKGGFDVESVAVQVEAPFATEEFTPVANETGTVCSSGTEDTRSTRAGDSKEDEGYRAFWSFDLYALRRTRVLEARLSFVVRDVVQDPFRMPSGLYGLHLYHIRTEPGGLPDYRTEPISELTESALWESPGEVDVTDIVEKIGLGISADDRLQVMASFQRNTNHNCLAEYIVWDKLVLTVIYAER